MTDDDYRCDWCGTTEQFTCRCWELEAARYRHEAAEATR